MISSVGIGFNHTPIIEDTISNISIANLFEAVKRVDKEFLPNPVMQGYITKSEYVDILMNKKEKYRVL